MSSSPRQKPKLRRTNSTKIKVDPTVIAVVFNEDDAFEEFELDTWKVDKNTNNQEDADLWQEDWGDKDVDEEFEKQLREQILSANKK